MSQIAEPQTAKELFAILKKFFEANLNYREHQDAWMVLSALRGPDSEDDDLKAATTLFIRAKLLGVDVTDRFSSPFFEWDNQKFLEVRGKLQAGHFKAHAIRAFTALGLKFYDVNPIFDVQKKEG